MLLKSFCFTLSLFLYVCLFCSPLKFSVTVAYQKSEKDRNFVIEIYNRYRALRAIVFSIQVSSLEVKFPMIVKFTVKCSLSLLILKTIFSSKKFFLSLTRVDFVGLWTLLVRPYGMRFFWPYHFHPYGPHARHLLLCLSKEKE